MKLPHALLHWDIDKALKLLAVVGLSLLLFLSGVTAHYYELPPSDLMKRAFTAGETWYQSLKDAAKRDKKMRSEKSMSRFRESDLNKEGKVVAADVTWNKDKAYNGYTLFSYRFSTAVQLVDMEGNIVYRWSMPFQKLWKDPPHIHSKVKAAPFIETAHVFPNGDLLIQYTGIGDTPYGYGIAKIDKDSNVIWKYAENAHHDFYVDKEGYIYALIHILMQEAPSKDLKDLSYPMLVDYIVKLSPDGKEIDRISILDAFRDSPFDLFLYHKQTMSRGKGWDMFHTNTIRKLETDVADKFPLFKPGSLLISLRNMNALAVIDPDTRKISWAYRGNWQWQHGARFLDNGNILLLDNLGHFVKNKNYAKVLEFNPQTLETTWDVRGSAKFPIRTTAYGRTQRLPNGNTLVDFAYFKRAIEFTPDGEIVWNYRVDNSSKKNSIQAITNAERYAAEEVPFLKDVAAKEKAKKQ